jgi:hypothetical protein
MIHQRFVVLFSLLVCSYPAQAEPETPALQPPEDDQVRVAGLDWATDYSVAYGRAQETKKMLLIHFVPIKADSAELSLEKAIGSDRHLQEKLGKVELARLPIDTKITSGGQTTALMNHGAFQHMQGKPGIAILDLANKGAPYYGKVTSAFPFTRGKYYYWKNEYLSVILDLPPGTITQRSMIWAVRVHPERPASTDGNLDVQLASAAANHSQHQADLGVQEHHQWGTRVNQIRSQVAVNTASEVVAESWPNQTMIDSCIDCVQSWRHSSGHWGAVRRRHQFFGYDIRRGRNGIWYGTGIFGN